MSSFELVEQVPSQTSRFLHTWFDGCGGFLELRAFRDIEVNRRFFPVNLPEKILEWATRHQGWDVYYGTCPDAECRGRGCDELI